MKTLMTTTAGLLIALGTAASAQSIDVSGAMAQGDTVTLPMVSMTANGYVVLHEVVDGKVQAPQSIGHVAVPEGENADVTVTADMALVAGSSYAAMLHDETNGNDTYDFGEGATDVDTPTMMDGKPVVKVFKVGTPAGEAETGTMESNDAMESTSPDSGAEMMDGEAPMEMMDGDAPMEDTGTQAQ